MIEEKSCRHIKEKITGESLFIYRVHLSLSKKTVRWPFSNILYDELSYGMESLREINIWIICINDSGVLLTNILCIIWHMWPTMVTRLPDKSFISGCCLWSNCYFRYVGTCLHLQNNLFFLISCQSLKNSSRGKKRPEPKGLLNQAKKEMLPEKKTGVPAAGLKVMCLLNGNRSLQGQNSGRRVPSLHNSVFPHFGQTAMNREQNGFWGWIHFMDINP